MLLDVFFWFSNQRDSLSLSVYVCVYMCVCESKQQQQHSNVAMVVVVVVVVVNRIAFCILSLSHSKIKTFCTHVSINDKEEDLTHGEV